MSSTPPTPFMPPSSPSSLAWWQSMPERHWLRSSSNPTVKSWKEHLESRHWIILEGLHLVQMFTDCYGVPPILILPSAPHPQPEVAAWVEAANAQENVWRLENAPLKLLASLNTPAPIVALAPYPRQTPAIGLLRNHSSLWLDNLQDPGNVGTLLRTALGAGIKHIVCGQGCADVWSPKVLRAAQGAHFHLTLWHNCNLVELAHALPDVPKWGAMPGGTPYYACRWPHPLALVLGNEGHGISSSLSAELNQTIGIPLSPQLESLNVAIAGAILLFESTRPALTHPA